MKSRDFVHFVLVVLMGIALSSLARAQTSIAGDWQGEWSISGAQLRFKLHIKTATDGSLRATLDSIDQNAMGIPVSTIEFKDSKLTFTIAASHISYVGTVNTDVTKIKGTITQSDPLPLDFTRARVQSAARPVAPPPLSGTWLGSLDTGAIKLRIVFKIDSKAGSLTAQLQSPDQSSTWMPVTSIQQTGDAVTISVEKLAVVYQGKIAADSNSITGTFTQAGTPLPLNLKRIKDQSELELRRPQNPVKPYPDREEDDTYPNKARGNSLAGTFAIPTGNGPFPAVELIVGSET